MLFSQFRYHTENTTKLQGVNMKYNPKHRWPVFMGVRVSEEMMDRIQKECKRENMDMSELVRRALAAYLLR